MELPFYFSSNPGQLHDSPTLTAIHLSVIVYCLITLISAVFAAVTA